MARIAALVLERRHAARFALLRERLRRSLDLSNRYPLEERLFEAGDTLCCLLRAQPDPVNRCPQPITHRDTAGMMCGYYLPPESLRLDAAIHGDTATSLFAALDADRATALRGGDGVFAYVRWNGREQALEAGVDKLGMRPLHWIAIPGGYVVASDLKALIVAQEKPTVSLPAWQERLAFGYPLGSHTLLEGASRFGEAEVIRFTTRGYRATRYEDFLGTIELRPCNIDDFLDEQRSLFDAAMQRLTALYDARNSTMLTLSGGYDSRRILAWLLDHDIRPEIFTVPEVLPDGREFESGIVRALCRHAKLRGWLVYPRTAADRALARRCRDLVADFQSDEHLFCAALALALEDDERVNFDGIGGDMAVGALYIKQRYLEAGGDTAFLDDFMPRATDWLSPPVETAALRHRCAQLLAECGDSPNRFTLFLLRQRTRRKISLASQTYQSWAIESLCPYFDRAFLRQTLSLDPKEKLRVSVQARSIQKFNNNFSDIASTHDPLDQLTAGYLNRFPRGGRMEHNALIGHALRLSARQPWRVPAAQRTRFVLTLLLGEAFGARRALWERNKANKLTQLSEFVRLTESPDTYLAHIAQFKGLFGSRRDFATLME